MSDTKENVFYNLLRQHANQYFEEFEHEEVNVRLVSKQVRSASILFKFELDVEDIHHRNVLIKVPIKQNNEQIEVQSNRINSLSNERPCLTPTTASDHKFQLEYTALKKIQHYFSGLNDSRFGTVNILDMILDQRAIVMEEVSALTLRHLFIKAGFFRPFFIVTDLDEPFYNTGAWLSAYHALPKENSVKIQQSHRTEFIETVTELTDFLTRVCGDKAFFDSVKSKSEFYVRRQFPEILPLGLHHGDYAPRNVLVSTGHRVTVLDTLAKWYTPIYRDIAYFLVGLKTIRFQVVSQGSIFSSKYIARCEQQFLAGYFEQRSIPYMTIRLYEIQALLDKWSAAVTRLDAKPFAGRHLFTRMLQRALLNHFFKKTTYRLIQDLKT